MIADNQAFQFRFYRLVRAVLERTKKPMFDRLQLSMYLKGSEFQLRLHNRDTVRAVSNFHPVFE